MQIDLKLKFKDCYTAEQACNDLKAINDNVKVLLLNDCTLVRYHKEQHDQVISTLVKNKGYTIALCKDDKLI